MFVNMKLSVSVYVWLLLSMNVQPHLYTHFIVNLCTNIYDHNYHTHTHTTLAFQSFERVLRRYICLAASCVFVFLILFMFVCKVSMNL